ncbi:MAG: hypothetical protein WCO30_00680 [bacterium]
MNKMKDVAIWRAKGSGLVCWSRSKNRWVYIKTTKKSTGIKVGDCMAKNTPIVPHNKLARLEACFCLW